MYKNQLDELRNVSDKILTGQYESKAPVARQPSIVPRRIRGKEQEAPAEEQGDDFFSALLNSFLEIREAEKEPVVLENTYTESGELRPRSRGQGYGSDTGYKLVEDLIDEFDLTREQAAGFVGNLDYETGGFKFMQEIEPMIPGSKGGYGFAQWTGPRRRQFESWSQEQGLDPSSYEANKGFLFHELKNTREGRVLESLRNVNDPQEAARVVSDEFLRPGIPNIGERMARASGYMEIE